MDDLIPLWLTLVVPSTSWRAIRQTTETKRRADLSTGGPALSRFRSSGERRRPAGATEWLPG
jgi:hypothetical protein